MSVCSNPVQSKDNQGQFNIEDSLGYLISKAHQWFSLCFKEKLAEYNLTPPQFGALAFLWKQDGISQVHLGNMMGKDRTTIGGIIDRLEKEDLVVRQSDPEDRRTNLIFLTEKGAGLKDTLEQIAAQTNLEVTAPLTDGERGQLRELLKKILANCRYECNEQQNPLVK
ncbi:transcriptional regulator, MarR family [Desulfotomaculum nigrificans CO-1-SRB]|uniref:Transcriptional regulator, MarR family n=1 Tax=Desulfotomaculum nigrificans (strain DSM 14880 / VKM B-2319 / CO-1-SRB) TaxID=868595 RepID=F6BA19_DESCC|nr:MarR family transcriptional regulator [Desulfotomaculum nigrificans]AEF94988.1 transcriptional regulator, MarR family [Desulfotomaculum nigrificans CO-1-SRB]